MSIPVAFATNDQCLLELDISMSYNVQATFLSKWFCRRLEHLPNIPEGGVEKNKSNCACAHARFKLVTNTS